MCGIFCSLAPASAARLETLPGVAETLQLLARRGPDRHGFHQHRCPTSSSLSPHSNHCLASFHGQVLWQQGAQPCQQPVVTTSADVLLWNGDIFGDRPAGGKQSDTEWLAEQLSGGHRGAEDVCSVFRSQVRGPFSFVYFDASRNQLYFGRDSLGRQTLLLALVEGTTILTSVASRELLLGDGSGGGCILELPPLGVFQIDVDTMRWSLYPWQSLYGGQLVVLEFTLGHEVLIGDCIQPEWLNAPESEGEPTWSFEAIVAAEVPKAADMNPTELFTALLQNAAISAACSQLLDLLGQSVRDRCLATPDICRDCIATGVDSCAHCRIAVLFSGGLDCTILALLADRYVLPATAAIDLLNVSFEKVRSATAPPAVINYNTPDRVSAQQTLLELQQLRPQRHWRLVEVDVDRRELATELSSHIAQLVLPLDTVLDESLGAALWFAARGRGRIHGGGGEATVPYTSTARVLLHGSGADELFAGYTRHSTAWRRGGWPALAAELQLDWARLPTRNLARDDRVCADHGRTARAPFVQEQVAAMVRQLAPEQRCLPSLGAGVGDKLLLRLVAHRLGLCGAAAMRKRALQFGSRIADSRQNAAERSGALNKKQ